MADENKLKVEDLESVTGGYTPKNDPGESQYALTEEELEKLFHSYEKGKCPYCGKVFG